MKKIFIIVSLLLCLTLLFTGCSDSSKATDSDSGNGSEEVEDTETEEVEDTEKDAEDVEEAASEGEATEEGEESEETVVGDSDFQSIADISDYWSDLYSLNEAVLNAYEGMPIMETVTPGLCFVTGVQYDLLNMDEVDGRFEGELMLAGYEGYVEKNGNLLNFGYDEVLEEDGFGPSSKKGDKKAESGNCDLEKGYFYTDNYTERAGAVIERSTSEFLKHEDGSMSTIVINGGTQNFRGEDDLTTSYIFIRNGKDQYDLIVAKATNGTNYEPLHIEADMTKEKAVAMFESVGATIEIRAGIKGGAFVLD